MTNIFVIRSEQLLTSFKKFQNKVYTNKLELSQNQILLVM